MLPQLVFVAALVLAFVFASRWAYLEVARVEGQMGRLRRMLRRAGRNPIPRLQLDETTGLYLPVKY
jgi:hypothetical protein